MTALIRNYSDDLKKIKDFLSDKKYKLVITILCNHVKTSINIDLADLQGFDTELCAAVLRNSKRYVELFSDVVFELMPIKMVEDDEKKDYHDFYIEHRFLQYQKMAEGNIDINEFFSKLPKALVRRYQVNFHVPRIIFRPLTIRQLKACKIGQLVTIKGIVTRISDVKPSLACGTYTCDQCGTEIFQPLLGATCYLPIDKCISEECRQKNASGRLYFQTRASRFIRFEELKVQEHSDQVPVGNIPRSLTVMAKEDLAGLVLPGDHVCITGIFLPTLKMGFKQMTGGLISETFLDAHRITRMNQNDNDETPDEDGMMTQEEVEEFILSSGDPYTKLANSIAPEIFGHDDLKRALLLLLIGGVDLSPYGMKIRGNINICMFGDPGVAKSQLLGFINRIAVRSQYTTGRGSSGVGLTASVTKDLLTGEMILEGGALVLADKGICCIDEFDKMAESDKVAIHEVMEQQTISIAKAGILTTLNARVSILAAANPIFGRYNMKKSIQQNIELPAALLSRFDLIWLITDPPNSDNDRRLAKHITEVHMTEQDCPSRKDIVDMRTMRRYIALCKTKNPIVPEFLTDYLVNAYLEMRKEARNNKHMATFTSPRTLLAILRLSTALARLRLADVVEMADANEAIRLIAMSKDSLFKHEEESGPNAAFRNSEKIFRIIKESAGDKREVMFKEVRDKCLHKGFTLEEFEEALEEYEELNIWQLSRDKTKILFV